MPPGHFQFTSKALPDLLVPIVFVLHYQASAGIEEEPPITGMEAAEVEHLIDRIRERIEGSSRDSCSTQPMIFDEAQYRSLVGYGVIDEVPLCPW